MRFIFFLKNASLNLVNQHNILNFLHSKTTEYSDNRLAFGRMALNGQEEKVGKAPVMEYRNAPIADFRVTAGTPFLSE